MSVSGRVETGTAARAARMGRVRTAMVEAGVDALLLSLGADLPWLTGYEAMPLERLTMLVLPADGDATLVVPRLEAPRVHEAPGLFELRPWNETEDPVGIVAGLLGRRRRLAVSDRAWASALLRLQGAVPGAEWSAASRVTGPIRAVKDAAEVECLRAAGAAADRVAAQLQAGLIPLVGRAEAEVSADISQRLRDEGHERVNFAIVGSGPNSASPHHHAGPRVIEAGDVVVCDFGGVLSLDGGPGYCSDITRTVVTGEPSAELRELYSVLEDAQARAVAAARAGTTCEEVDGVARRVIAAAGFGDCFIHRTGHGIGLEEHEDPYLVQGNGTPLEPGHAFSVEPGIYLAGRFGARLEDIVVATEEGPLALNSVDHALAVVG
ncbi:MAG TPA: Xaa-Pro peptidase family protein [Acidimicrobiales bacterium]|nr:Xaa-Pro peptidase family protein [Acidimicrobiales bacterium]